MSEKERNREVGVTEKKRGEMWNDMGSYRERERERREGEGD